jgi:hypothetical protein
MDKLTEEFLQKMDGDNEELMANFEQGMPVKLNKKIYLWIFGLQNFYVYVFCMYIGLAASKDTRSTLSSLVEEGDKIASRVNEAVMSISPNHDLLNRNPGILPILTTINLLKFDGYLSEEGSDEFVRLTEILAFYSLKINFHVFNLC